MPLTRRDFLAVSTTGAAMALGGRAAFADSKELVVGCSFPLSGPGASTGITAQRAVERGVELINKQGIQIGADRYTLKPVFYDNKYVPAEAVTVVEKMLAEGVRYVMSLGSGNSVPVVAKTTALKALQLSLASGKDHLTAPQFPLSFRTSPTNETAYAVYPWLKVTYASMKRIGHMNPSDEAGFTESEDRRKLSEKAGFTNVANEYFKRGSTDFYPVATRLVAANPELIDFGGTIGRDQALACKALRELGYKGVVMLGYSDAKSFVDVAGAEAAEGTLLFDTLAEATTPAQKELWDWWVAKYGPPFPSYAFTVYDTMPMLAEAIRQAQSVDTEKVAAVLRTLRWNGIYGEMRFGMKSVYGHDCSMVRKIPMAVIKGGQPKALTMIDWPADV